MLNIPNLAASRETWDRLRSWQPFSIERSLRLMPEYMRSMKRLGWG